MGFPRSSKGITGGGGAEGAMVLVIPGSVALGRPGTVHALLLLVRVGPCLEAFFGEEGGPLPRSMSLRV